MSWSTPKRCLCGSIPDNPEQQYGGGVATEHKDDRPGLKRRWARVRDRLRDRPAADFVYRVVVGAIGLAVLAVGLVAIPYPGPGWAILFLGLAILATEFSAAQRALKYLRRRYDDAMAWFRRQHIAVQGIGTALTGAVVAVTLWMLGAVGWSAELVGVEWAWLQSPIGLGS
jgi:uncharacterized protein (TIGR02611 family)